MGLLLYPRAAPGQQLRVWVGATERTAAPNLTWTLTEKGMAASALPAGQPVALRAISSVRPPAMIAANVPRAFAGVYEFNGLKAGTTYNVTVRAEDKGEVQSLYARTLPANVPHALNETFNVLLVSCFHQAEDPGGMIGVGAGRLTGPDQPHLTLLMGDQVYLDLPSTFVFPTTTAGLAADFEKKYLANWGGPEGYSRVLASAPTIAIPDDHEFWNNYPHKFPLIANTESDTERNRWREAARTLYEGFQLHTPTLYGAPTKLDVAPLSFFLADTRSQRDFDFRFTMHPDFFPQLEQWVQHVIDNKLYGIFVSGQSLFRKEPATLTDKSKPNNSGLGKVGDYEMFEYADYGPIVKQLARLADAGLPLVCITGDVHFGRYVAASDTRRMSGQAAIYEIISSPASLVTTPGFDQLNIVKSFFSSPEAKKWPRWADADEPPPSFALSQLQNRFPCKMLDKQRGNHVAMLSFRNTGGNNLEAKLKFFPLHQKPEFRTPREANQSPLKLSPLI